MAGGATSEPNDGRTRRNVLTLFGAGLAAALGALLGRTESARAADGDSLVLGSSGNSASNPTFLGATIEGNVVLAVANSGSGNGFEAASQSGTAIHGFSEGTGNGVAGSSPAGTGVAGGSNSGTAGSFGSGSGDGVVGYSNGAGRGGVFHSETGNGLEGSSKSAIAVLGFSDSGHGGVFTSKTNDGVAGGSVSGTAGTFGSEQGDGVLGHSEAGGAGGRFRSVSGPGVHASSGTGLALDVAGMARFSSADGGTIPAGQNSTFVANAAVTAKSHISVTLASDPGGRKLSWVAKTPGSGFTVNAPGPANARPATQFTYLIVEAP